MAPITVDTALSPATFFTVLALVFAVYYFIFKLFQSSSKLGELTEEQEQKQNNNGDDILTTIESSEIAEIPEDLITEILQLLPVKTLLRFRCISKSLLDIINSPKFRRWHLTKTASNNRTHPKIILVEQCPHFNNHPPVPVRVYDIDDPFLVDPCKGDPTDLGFGQYSFNRTSFPVFGHCNGLVVLEEHPFSLVVWNPTIRKCRKLPVLPKEDPLDHLEPGIINLGFGYDSSMDDYKVLVIKERRFFVPVEDVETRHECWVLGFRSGHWRRIELPDNLDNFTNFFLDGALLFLSCSTAVIFAFDLAKETFSEVSLSDFGPAQEHPTNLQVFEGCLCVMFTSREQQRDELYARKKNDEGEICWIKLFSIPCQQLSDLDFSFYHTGVILGYSKDGDKIFVISSDQYGLYSYDLKQKSFGIVLGYEHNRQKMFSYIESLVWINVEENEKGKEEATQEQRKSLGLN